MRAAVKRQLARLPDAGPARGATLLVYHRVGAAVPDELDTPTAAFAAQLDVLDAYDVVSLDVALDRLDAGDERPTTVITFDDGFADVHANAWPQLRERALPFTVYLAAGLLGGPMRWEGSTSSSTGAALSWDQVEEMVASGLCTAANHTWSHARPDGLDASQLDRCSDEVERRLGCRPRHFAYTWGIEVPHARVALRDRFRSAATGRPGRNLSGCDRLALARVPVRGTDPIEFYAAKLRGSLRAERAYDALVRAAKRAGARA